MFVRKILIERENDWGQTSVDPTKPMRATITVQGQHGKIELNLSPELSAQVMAVIAEHVADAGKATAEAMTAEVFTVAALPKPEAA